MMSRFFNMTRISMFALAAMLLAGSSATTFADSNRRFDDDSRFSSRGSYSLGFRNGYRSGFRDGRYDAYRSRSERRSFGIRRGGFVSPYYIGFERGYSRGYEKGFDSVKWRSRDRRDRDDRDWDRDGRRHHDDDDE